MKLLTLCQNEASVTFTNPLLKTEPLAAAVFVANEYPTVGTLAARFAVMMVAAAIGTTLTSAFRKGGFSHLLFR